MLKKEKCQNETLVFPGKYRIVREVKRELSSPPCRSQDNSLRYSLRNLDFTCNICMSVLPIAPLP